MRWPAVNEAPEDGMGGGNRTRFLHSCDARRGIRSEFEARAASRGEGTGTGGSEIERDRREERRSRRNPRGKTSICLPMEIRGSEGEGRNAGMN